MVAQADDLMTGLAIRRLADCYALAADTCDGDLFAAQFTADGVLEAPRGRFVGRQALTGVPRMLREHYCRTFHAVLNQVPVINGDEASAQTYSIARHFFRDGTGQPLCTEMTIRYQDRFRQTANGWLFFRRELVVDATRTFQVVETKH